MEQKKIWRFKTKEEFQSQFGTYNWRNEVKHHFNDRMDALLGQPVGVDVVEAASQGMARYDHEGRSWMISIDMLTLATAVKVPKTPSPARPKNLNNPGKKDIFIRGTKPFRGPWRWE